MNLSVSVEAKYLAERINKFVLESETSRDDKIYEEGKREFDNIKRDINFITARGLDEVVTVLDENGQQVYKRYFEKYFEQVKIKIKKGKYASG